MDIVWTVLGVFDVRFHPLRTPGESTGDTLEHYQSEHGRLRS